MRNKILELAREYDMLPPGATVLCALSGGADSMCLVYLLSSLGVTVAAAHYNHRLRGAESDRDEQFVRRWCSEHAIPITIGSGDVGHEAARLGQGIEETARAMRYAFLHETAEALGAERIATAHNADDNAETLLLHLLRGTGLQGLTGITPRRGELVRPLLTVTRAEIEAYCAEYQVPYVEDSTNADTAYTRNRLRHTVLPLLREMNPRIVENLGSTTRLLRADNDFLNAQAAAVCAHARWAEDNLVIEARFLAEAPDPVASRAARRLVEMMGNGGRTLCAPTTAIVDLCRGEDPSAIVHLPGGLMAQRVYRELLLTTEEDPIPFSPVPLHEGENPIPGTGWTVTIGESAPPGLVARPRKTGDEISLPKRDGKTLKKLFIEAKIPRREREQIPVIADELGVLAVAGFGKNRVHPAYETLKIDCKKDG